MRRGPGGRDGPGLPAASSAHEGRDEGHPSVVTGTAPAPLLLVYKLIAVQ